MTNRHASRWHDPRLAVLAILAVCAAVYWVGLGSGGFHATEGHRVIPAYEMLDHAGGIGDWLVPRMFEQPYLRKPPGMPWAVALSTEVLGRTVFAARAVSALSMTLMALAAFWFGRRWFGPVGGLAAGLAQALMPVLWESGRAAEIEALNMLAAQLGAFCLLEAMLRRHELARWAWWSVAAALGIAASVLAKGPASLPVFLGVAAACVIVTRSAKPLGRAGLALSLAFTIVTVWLLLTVGVLNETSAEPVTQSPSAFMFEPGQLLAIALLPLAAFAQFMPVSLALLFPWGPDAKAETGRGLGEDAWHVGRVLSVAFVATIVLFMAFGVRNPRYTLPAAGLLPPLVGLVVSGLGVWMTSKREGIARLMLLGRPWVWVALLVPAAWAYIGVIEAERRGTSGGNAGVLAAGIIADWARDEGIDNPIPVLADHLIEARPEVLLALEQEADRLGIVGLRVIWVPGLSTDADLSVVEGPAVLALRTDGSPSEADVLWAELGSAGLLLAPADSGEIEVHKYLFQLYLWPGTE